MYLKELIGETDYSCKYKDMFKKGLLIPTFMKKEGSEELERLGIYTEDDGVGEVENILVYNVTELHDHEENGVKGSIYYTGNSGGLFSPLSMDELGQLIDRHIEKYK